MERINPKIAAWNIDWMLEDPFYASLLSTCLKAASGRVEDTGWSFRDDQPVLLIQPAWLKQHPPVMRFRHELLHLIFGHPAAAPVVRYPALYHVAADLVVNQYMPVAERNADELTLETFSELGLQPDRETAHYYRQLEFAWETYRHGESGRRAFPEWLRLLERAMEGALLPLRRHRFWWVWPGAQRQELRQICCREIVKQASSRIDGGVLQQLPAPVREQLSPPAKATAIDWKRRLRLFAAGSRRSRLRSTIRRPSKRYGTTPGLQLTRRGRFLVAVDTSASIAPEWLSRFFGEIHRLWRSGCDILVVECDVRIRRRYQYQGTPPSAVTGRGGTLFDAPIAWANDHYFPDGVLYFTDGQGPAPRVNCRCPLLWVLKGNQQPADHLIQFPGSRILELPDT